MTVAAESPQPNLMPAALAYINRLGWPVFPVHGVVNGRCTCGKADCSRPGKHPIGGLAPRGLLDASADPVKVGDWWRSAPYANIGVPTGVASGLAVLDVDLNKGGFDGHHELQQRYGTLPETVMAITGSGGYHYLFAHPGNGIKIKNSVRELGDGLDVRGDGGYIIVAPSSHISGRRYEWEASCRPAEMPLAPLPDWLLTLIADSPRPATQPPDARRQGKLWPREIRRIKAALEHLPPEPYDVWVMVGMALHSTGDAAAFDLWTEWAAKSAEHTFDPAVHAHKWQHGFSRKPGGVSLGTLFAAAKERGYITATPPPDDPPPPPDDPPPGGPDDPIGDWEALLYRNNRGEPITSPANLETVLEHHPGWAGALVYDDMSYRTLKRKPPPYPGGEAGEWSDADDTWTAIWMERGYGMRPKNAAIAQVVAATAKHRRFHQVLSLIHI